MLHEDDDKETSLLYIALVHTYSAKEITPQCLLYNERITLHLFIRVMAPVIRSSIVDFVSGISFVLEKYRALCPFAVIADANRHMGHDRVHKCLAGQIEKDPVQRCNPSSLVFLQSTR
jgi:hypothetical protein